MWPGRSSNVLFGAELAQYPERSQASFQRSLQPVPTEALRNHRRAFERWTVIIPHTVLAMSRIGSPLHYSFLLFWSMSVRVGLRP